MSTWKKDDGLVFLLFLAKLTAHSLKVSIVVHQNRNEEERLQEKGN